MKLRIGLIGLGKDWDVRHGPALRSLSDRFEVRAVCEEVALRGEQIARQFNAAAVEGFRAVARRDDIDALLVLSSRWYGPLPILAACEYGKDVYCGGAWDLSGESVGELKRRIDEAGIAFMVDFPRRVAPATVRLKELIVTRLGSPRLLFCHQRRQLKGLAGGHSANGAAQADAEEARHLLELIDWCQYVAGGHATSVSAVSHQATSGKVADYQSISLDFSPPGTVGSGPMAQISCGYYLQAIWPEAISFRPPADLQVCCEKGVAFVDLPSSLVWFDEAGRHRESLDHERPAGELLLWQFHRQVTRLLRDTSGLEDVYSALNVLINARVSLSETRRVFLQAED